MATKKRFSKVQIFRTLVQILFFMLLPGLYATAFAGIKTVYLGILQNTFDFAQDFPSLIGALSIIPITLLLGRFFCGWMCAFGAIGDWFYLLGKKVFHIKYTIHPQTDSLLKFVKYILLIFLVTLIWSFDLNLDIINPWNAFGVLATVTKVPDISYALQYFAIGTFVLLFIIIGSLFVERFFCRYLCPLGAIFAIVSKCSFFKIKKPCNKCESCKLCTTKCSMGIPMYKYDKVTSGECIQCLKCISNCPRKNANLAMLDNELNPAFAGALAVAAITGIYCVGSLISDTNSSSSSVVEYSMDSQVNQAESGNYEDGIYEGRATGFRGATTKVSVTVENGYITDIETISNGDDAPYYNRAFSSVTQDIIDTQDTTVDAVSGATYSSKGIMNAVADALENASVSSSSTSQATTEETTTKEIVEETTTTHEPITQETTTPEQTVASVTSGYADGTYTGSGTGFHRGTTTVSVTVSGGIITDIEVLSHQDDAPYFNRAYNSVASDIISTQSTNVDAVSGATFSSNGIMDAVEDALSQAQ